MKRNLIWSLLTGVLFGLALPPWGLGLFAYWCLVPLWVLLERTEDVSEALAWGLLTGLFVSFGTVPALGFAGLSDLLLSVVLSGLYFGLYAAAHVFLRRRLGAAAWALLPLVWVGIEFLRTFSGLAWTNLALTHMHMVTLAKGIPPLVVTLWLVLINVVVYQILMSIRHRARLPYLLAAILLLFLVPFCLNRCSTPKERDLDDGLHVARF